MMRARIRVAEVLMALAVITIAAAFLVDGWNLAPSIFEPVGSGAVPNSVAGATILLALLVLAGLARTETDEQAESERWRVAGLSAALLVAYVVALGFGVRYQWATLAYVLFAIAAMAPQPRRALPAAAGVAVVLAFGLDYVFRYLLVTDLP